MQGKSRRAHKGVLIALHVCTLLLFTLCCHTFLLHVACLTLTILLHAAVLENQRVFLTLLISMGRPDLETVII